MYQQIPGQNQQVFVQNYGIPVNQNIALPPNPNQYVNQIPIQNPQNVQYIQKAGRMSGGGKRKSYTPGQYQTGQLFLQPPQLVPNQAKHEIPLPGKHNIMASQRPFLNKTINPIPGIPPQQHQIQGVAHPNPQNPQQPNNNNKNLGKTATFMTVNTLSKLPYSQYEQAEYSSRPFYNISGYAFNSYNGKVREYNEDRTRTIVNYRKEIMTPNGKKIYPRISYFGIFDGHGGEGCSNFLNANFHSFLFNSQYFPGYPIQAVKEAFINVEKAFMQQAIDKNSNTLVDKSGSCACVMLIINDMLYSINLGDSRALLSSDSGQTLRQITRDHKPNDPIEKIRIEKSGAQVYYANKVNVNGKEVVLRESDYGPGFTFPYRINPGGISVSFIYYIIFR